MLTEVQNFSRLHPKMRPSPLQEQYISPLKVQNEENSKDSLIMDFFKQKSIRSKTEQVEESSFQVTSSFKKEDLSMT